MREKDNMEFVDVLLIMITGLWLYVPAMVPNSNAALIGRYCNTSLKMDFGKTWKGKRIFGDGKSWVGFFGGAITAILIGFLQLGIAALCGDSENFWGFGPFWGNVGILCTMSFGALLGDLCGAFIKRRLGMERGQKAPVLDQYDFFVGSFLLTFAFFPDFIISNFIEGWHIAALIFILVMTFVIHRGVNIIGYKLGVKNEPW